MKAVVLPAPGGPEVLELRELPDPVPSDGEVLVRLRAAGVNPVDAKQRTHGTRIKSGEPAILGCDGAGVIEKRGPGAARFREGDEVYFCYGGVGAKSGCYAELTVVPESSLAAKAKSQDFVHAAAGPLVLITAWEALHDRLSIHEGMTLLVVGGTGGVGHAAIQLARDAGARVCATAGSEAKAQFARELGAEHVILYGKEEVAEAAKRWAGGEGVDCVLDTVSGKLLPTLFGAIHTYGKLVSILTPSEPLPWGTLFERNIGLYLEYMLSPQTRGLPRALERQREILERCADLCDSGKLSITVSKTMPLAQASQAHREIETAATMGKIVLEI